MAVYFERCANTRQWSRFTEFYLEHRALIIPHYPVNLALRDVKNYMRQGRAAVLVNERGETVGIGSFVLGLAEAGYEHKEIAVLGNSFFKAEYRSNRTFIRGLQVLSEQIKDANPDVQEVRIPTQATNAYTNRLYQKLAGLRHSYDTRFGTVNVYSASFRAYADFCSRFA